MEGSESAKALLIVIFLSGIGLFFIFVLIIRWIFSINEIVDLLKKINEQLQQNKVARPISKDKPLGTGQM